MGSRRPQPSWLVASKKASQRAWVYARIKDSLFLFDSPLLREECFVTRKKTKVLTSLIRPTVRCTLRAFGGRKIRIEGHGSKAPAFFSIGGGGAVPCGAWLSAAELRRLLAAARKILK